MDESRIDEMRSFAGKCLEENKLTFDGVKNIIESHLQDMTIQAQHLLNVRDLSFSEFTFCTIVFLV